MKGVCATTIHSYLQHTRYLEYAERIECIRCESERQGNEMLFVSLVLISFLYHAFVGCIVQLSNYGRVYVLSNVF